MMRWCRYLVGTEMARVDVEAAADPIVKRKKRRNTS